MTGRPRVPGLNDDWADAQLELTLEPGCGSCNLIDPAAGYWECDPDRPGCPLHQTPEQTRERVGCYACNGSGIVEDHDGDRPCLGCHNGAA